jgi:hypothetical protein
MVQFFNYAQDVGNEEMQKLWAKLLAGEVSSPGSYSLRTLQAVHVLRQADAVLFQKFSTYVWNGELYFVSLAAGKVLQQKGLRIENLFHLDSLGFLTVDNGISLQIEDPYTDKFINCGQAHHISCKPKMSSIP